jgi:hypothetical protein
MTKQEMLEKIESIRTANGGFIKKDLASLGIAWPPVAGWKKKLIEDCDD